MHVLVLGAGLLGTTTAWYLRQAGHSVTVIERQPGPALETSFANGGQISVSYAEPWANPAAPLKILKWLGRADAPLRFRPRADPLQWRWGLAFLRECSVTRTRRNTQALVNLGLYSRNTLITLRQTLGLEYQHLERGILHLYRSTAEYAAAEPGMRLMQAAGMTVRFLRPDAIAAIEPALAPQAERFAGAVYAPEDESGDARQFTEQLAAQAARAGVTFRFNTTVTGLELAGVAASAGHTLQREHPPGSTSSPLSAVTVQQNGVTERLQADAYVMALGSWSAPWLRTVGVDTLIYPAKGYSATLPIREPARVCSVSLTDHALKLVFTRLGDRLRVAGTAELNGYDLHLDPRRCALLSRRAAALFPEALDLDAVAYWTGLRPATPSNVPYVGRSRVPNLWLNTGHGTLGWTHGAGSGRALAALIDGHTPAVDFPFLGR